MKKPLRVMVLGLRGFPNVQGGVESHAEHLCRELVRLGCQMTVVVRSRYQAEDIGQDWQGMRFQRIWSPSSSGLETIVHTFLGVLYAAVVRPDILHIQAIGPAFMTPLARLLGLRVVVTHHGEDYNRQKWGRLARLILQLGENFGMKYAHGRITISLGLQKLVRSNYQLDSAYISNGVDLPQLTQRCDALEQFGLTSRNYVLLVSRLVPEKRHLDLIEAFAKADMPGWKLVLVGKADHPDPYVISVLNAAANASNVVCTGFQTGEALRELYSHAGLFVLPSSHEGLPIAILEAMSYGLPILASDIPANREVACSTTRYFPLGNVTVLAEMLNHSAKVEMQSKRRDNTRRLILRKYQWSDVARKTHALYESITRNTGGKG
jgi:glycosyltransferase involved in cell wall biosynthesis